MSMDPMFFAAAGAFAWGASLVAYRPVAKRLGWPMGRVQARAPWAAILIGLVCMAAGAFDSIDRIDQPGIATLTAAGVLLAVFWIGFMRVASQISLLLGPAMVLLLMLDWVWGR